MAGMIMSEATSHNYDSKKNDKFVPMVLYRQRLAKRKNSKLHYRNFVAKMLMFLVKPQRLKYFPYLKLY